MNWRKIGRFALGLLSVGVSEYIRRGRGAKPRDAVDAIIEEAIKAVLGSVTGLMEYRDVERELYSKLDGYGYRDHPALRTRVDARLPSAFAEYKRRQV